MNLPFTSEEFFGVFASYNNAVYPIQYLLITISLANIVIIYKKFSKAYFLIPLFLAFLWAWMGIVYHIGFFSSVNPAARVFGIIFVLQAILLIYSGVIKKSFQIDTSSSIRTYASAFLIGYALVLYPIITIATDHSYPYMPTFGLPCPTTIYTLGLFLLLKPDIFPKYLPVIPILWSIVGTSAAFQLGVSADFMLIVSSVVFVLTLVWDKRSQPSVSIKTPQNA